MADVGSQVFWLYCLPCHGDRGQGLTDEFRAVYPPEDRNCWTSGCHGKRPYENGFTLPVRVPPLIGPNTLLRFNTALELHDYIRQAMPWQDPGSLAEDTAWQVTAFLAREHGSDPINEPLANARAARVSLHAHDVQAQTSADRPRGAIWIVGSAILLIGLLVSAAGYIAHRARRGAG
jgi:cytochrome c